MPQANVVQGAGATAGAFANFDTSPLPYLQNLNHNPLDMGDNLPTPNNPTTAQTVRQPDVVGFPHLARDPLAELERSDGPGERVDHLDCGDLATQRPGSPSTSVFPIADDGHGLPWMGIPNATSIASPADFDYTIVRPDPDLSSSATRTDYNR